MQLVGGFSSKWSYMAKGGDESDYSWSSDDELEKEENSFDPSSALAAANGGAFAGAAEVSDISSSCSSVIMARFVSSAFNREVQNPLVLAGPPPSATLLAGILQYQIAWWCSVALFATRSAVVLLVVAVRAIPILVLPLLLYLDSADKSYHKRFRILESMSKVKSYAVLLDLECDALVLDIFHILLASIKDEHPCLMLAHIESILVGILNEADDLLLEFLISIISRSQAMGSPSSTTQALSKRVLEIYAHRIPLQQIISSINESMHSKEKEEEGNMDSILNALLTYAALESSPSDEQNVENPLGIEANGDLAQRTEELFDQNIDAESDLKNDDDSDFWSSGYDEITPEDFSDSDNCNGIEELSTSSEKDQKFLFLTDMGYPEDEVTIAMQRCGPDASIGDIADFLCAAQLSRASDASYVDPPVKPKRKILECQLSKKKRPKAFFEDDEQIRLPKPMIGFGVPTEPFTPVHRTLPEAARGPPYFYYENVALAPKGVWDTISRFLYDVEPEFVDSKYFCAAARKRGYIHNLPIENRSPLLPIPPRSISEALPLTKKWWPHWDTRKKLNCLQTAIGSAKLTDRIRKALEQWDGDPPLHVQKYVLDECRKWNLVWVGRNKVAPLEPDEVEMLLGFPRNHTRGGGISRTDRYKSLGNSFQVDTVAYHLSVLKYLFLNGIKVLSLFSGIGGAEVALHRLGIPLKVVVSVEISEVNRNIMRSWWEQTNQKGTLIDIADIQQLTGDRLEHLIGTFGGFDLVIGGSPCNNLAGSNRVFLIGVLPLPRPLCGSNNKL
ncbi:hypothetical protein Cgig2_001784 [Carnegiea gigantea]|uniref:DNA (cytosine-5-)-methyltransferase n=1 Tax=Carnegiea gigantea TaxID=171969 RepID=A0A9Q1KEF8_9CARY|nr:hypothetical protein Cgig2_001784 [Carnegiea gigantea]